MLIERLLYVYASRTRPWTTPGLLPLIRRDQKVQDPMPDRSTHWRNPVYPMVRGKPRTDHRPEAPRGMSCWSLLVYHQSQVNRKHTKPRIPRPNNAGRKNTHAQRHAHENRPQRRTKDPLLARIKTDAEREQDQGHVGDEFDGEGAAG